MGEKILICDRDQKNRDLLKELLGNTNDLIVIDDENQCVDLLSRSSNIQLLLISLNTIGADKNKVLEKIKETSPNINIFVTINPPISNTAKVIANRCISGYLEGPFAADLLKSKLKNLIK